MEFKVKESIFIQIANRICDEILRGVYGEGERIPSVRDYAVLVEVNVNTIIRSYEYLQNKEIIYNKRGIGYFVSSDAKSKIQMARRKTFIEEVLPEFFRQMSLLNIKMEEVVEVYNRLNKNNV